jgi:hypothetical protein
MNSALDVMTSFMCVRFHRNASSSKLRSVVSKEMSLLIAFIFLLLVPAGTNAQAVGGSIIGTVTGQSGTATPGCIVTVTDESSTAARTVTTNTDGYYIFPDLPAGNYEMSVSSPGFVTQIMTTINLAVGSERVLNVVMKPGNPKNMVRTAAPVAPISQASACCGGSTNSSTVRDTPLNGRDWAQMATLQAGVTGVQNGSATGGGNTTRGFGAAISISGSRPDQNSYRLDGISINDYSNGAPGSVLGDNLGIDAVEQVSVLGSNYPAEYGRTSGGVINAVTRAGKNAFHGTLYEFMRNSALDARNFFDGPVIPPFKRNQFGGSGGLPIQKGRTFIFGDYEGLRQSLGQTTVNTVPSAAARNGQLSSATVTVDPAVSRYLAAFYPLPNGPLLGSGDTGIYTFADQQATNENYFTLRGDHLFSDKNSLTVTYMRDNSETVQPGSFDELLSNVVSARQVATIQEQHIFSSTFLNSARVGYLRAVGITGGVSKVSNPLMLDPTFAFQPGGFAGAIENVPGLTNFTGAPSAQGLLPSSQSLTWNSFQGGDDVFLTRGRHGIKFGGNFERIQDNQLVLSNVNGRFRFASLLNLLTNLPNGFQGNSSVAPAGFGIRQSILGAYIQDDFRIHKDLTINLGLRYETATVINEVNNRLSNLRNLTDAQPVIGSPFFLNPTRRNFEPRVGFAWNPGGGKTLIRGGFGMFDVLPLPYEFSTAYQHSVPFVQEIYGNITPPGSFPTGAFTALSNQASSRRVVYAEHAPKRNYVMQWNLSVARELSSTLALTVGYVGSRGIHQPYKVDNIDMVLPTQLTPAGYIWPCGPDGNGNPCASGFLPTGTQANPVASTVLNPSFGRIGADLWQGNSFYDALQADLTKRVSHGIQFHAAYTWGKSIDTLSASGADDAFPNGLFNQLFFDQRTTRGLSDFDVAQTAVISFTWQLASPAWGTSAEHSGRLASLGVLEVPKWALSGWQLGALYKITTGQPFTATVGGDAVGQKIEESGQRPDMLGGPGCQTLTNTGNPNHYIKTQCLVFPVPGVRWGNLARNTLIGPGLSKLDFSVFKNNHFSGRTTSNSGCSGNGCGNSIFNNLFSEGFNLQFRAEFFNILNKSNFSSPTDNLAAFDQNGQSIASAGLIDSTQTTSRQIQFALKLIW